ncbi:hypothetical protein NFI96_005041 [Prochilodus magdalenae]|nr:hypothetical protein NFI96_005041 [Prochilodus magdalenae]
MDYGKEELRKHSKPDVYAFAKKSTTNLGKLTLTCMATGFYPKDVKLHVRKFKTSLPEHLVASSGVRPNEDGTYQLRKSVDIQADEKAEYDCFVTHVTLREPVITKWDNQCNDCQGGNGAVIAAVVAVLLILVGVALVILVLIKKKKIGVPSGPGSDSPPPCEDESEVPGSDSNSDSSSDSGKGTGSTNSSDENTNGEHSLYYIYTALSKDLTLPGIYEFTALGLLDDREIDYYNSKEQMKVPKQHWMKEKMQGDYWEKGTQSRKSKEQWFKVNVDILMDRMRHNKTDLHVLQWRHGCEIDDSTGEVKFRKGIDEYSYDGSEFLSFDDENMRWIAPVPAAEQTKRKWDGVTILNQYTKGYLEKECVDWLTKFMDYGKEELRKHSPPDVHVFAKKCSTDSNKLTLTCLATGFYPKDVVVSLRKFRTSIPEHLLTSSGVRPNGDETYQLRKSVEILEHEKADYDCYVSHSTLRAPVVKQWDGKCYDCTTGNIVSFVLGALFTGLVVVLVVICVVLRRKGIIYVVTPGPHHRHYEEYLSLYRIHSSARLLAETHSLSYLYTVQSKSSPDRGSGFSVVTLLDDEQIDFYISISTNTGGTRTPKQEWLRKMKESEWKDGTEMLKYDGIELNHILKPHMKALGHNESGGHTLQWRISCGDGERSEGSVVNAINKYGYDGEDFISYNWNLKKWTASGSQAKKMEDEWNAGKGQNPDQKHENCETWLKIYLQYKSSDIRLRTLIECDPPGQLNVYLFSKKPETNSNKLNLTCLATGFYPKNVVLRLRKCGSSLPERLLTSSGVRPNEDGTYQQRKSVEIQEDHTAEYDCYVTHSSLQEPVIKQWGGESSNCQTGGVTGGVTRGVTGGVNVGVTLVVVASLAAVGVIIYICRKKCASGETSRVRNAVGYRPPGGVKIVGAKTGSAEKLVATPQISKKKSSEQQKTAKGPHSQVEGQAPQTSSTGDGVGLTMGHHLPRVNRGRPYTKMDGSEESDYDMQE